MIKARIKKPITIRVKNRAGEKLKEKSCSKILIIIKNIVVG
jgi:hypothetical protein